MKTYSKYHKRVETLEELKQEISKEIIDEFFDKILPYETECIKKAQAGEIDAVPYKCGINEWCDIHHVNIYKINDKKREITFNVNGELILYSPYDFFKCERR